MWSPGGATKAATLSPRAALPRPLELQLAPGRYTHPRVQRSRPTPGGGAVDKAAHPGDGLGGATHLNMGLFLQQMTTGIQAMAASSAHVVERLTALENAHLPPPTAGPPPSAAGGSTVPRTPGGRSGTALGPPGALGNPQTQVPLDSRGWLPPALPPSKPTQDRRSRVWRSLAGPKYYLARGSFSVTGDVSHDVLNLILKNVAWVSDASAKQLQALSDFVVEAFAPSAPAGTALVPMLAEVHFRAFIAALVAVLNEGMEHERELCASHGPRSWSRSSGT